MDRSDDSNGIRREFMNASELLARLENVPFSRWHTKARVIVGSATFFDAFSALSLAFALPVLIGLWHITPAQTGLLISSSYIGQLIGALLFSSLAEKFGRIPSAASATALMSVMSLACAFALNFPALLVCRFVQGIGVGGEMPVAAAYISELSRARGRGRFFLLYELIFPIGLMATGQIGAWVVPAFGWKSIFWIGGVPGLLVTILLAGLAESPRWLIAKGRLSEAEAIIKQIEIASIETVGALGEAQARQQAASSDERPERSQTAPTARGRWHEVLGPAFRSRTLIVWTLWAMTFFVTNSLNNWLPSLYSTVYRLELRQSLRAASMTNIAQVAVLLVCVFCIDRIGRKKWTTVSLAAGAGALLLLGLTAASSVRSVIVFATLSYGIIGSVNAVLYLYTPEIYPTRMRAIGTGLATCWLWLASAVGPFVVGFVVGSGGTRTVFLMFAAAGLIGAFAATAMLETRGKRLEEIAI
jgi:MFS transporter, putative metabolite:H+ symporter